MRVWCTCHGARGGRVLSPGERARDRLRNPTLRDSQPCGLRALEGAHYAGRAPAPPTPPARIHGYIGSPRI